MIKILKLGIEGKLLNLRKDIYKNKNTQLILFLKIKYKMLSFKIGNKTKMPALITYIQYYTREIIPRALRKGGKRLKAC